MATLVHIKSIALRSQKTLVQDVFGLAALIVMFVVSLHLPDFF